jgi:hypothetical protein
VLHGSLGSGVKTHDPEPTVGSLLQVPVVHRPMYVVIVIVPAVLHAVPTCVHIPFIGGGGVHWASFVQLAHPSASSSHTSGAVHGSPA